MTQQDTVNEIKRLFNYTIQKIEAIDATERKKTITDIELASIKKQWEHIQDKSKPHEANSPKLTIDLKGLAAGTGKHTTITGKTVEPQPIIWLGRGYMGDAGDI